MRSRFRAPTAVALAITLMCIAAWEVKGGMLGSRYTTNPIYPDVVRSFRLLGIGTPQWEWFAEPIDASQEVTLEQACDGYGIDSTFYADDGHLLVVVGSSRTFPNVCLLVPFTESLFLFRLDDEGQAVARMKVPKGIALREAMPLVPRHAFAVINPRPTVQAPVLSAFSRWAPVASGVLELPARFAFDSPKLGQSD